MNRYIVAVVLFASTLAFAGDMNPKKAAEISRDRDKAMAAIAKKYEGKKLTRSQIQERAAEENAAEAKVLSKHGVDAKEYGRYDAKMSKSDRQATAAETEKLKAKEAEDAKAAAAKKDGPKEIQVQKGFSDENPTVMDEKEGAPPVVEKGIPVDAK